MFESCNPDGQQTSDSGVTKATIKVQTNEKGHTTEQENIIDRYERNNEAGSIKHLYIISAYTGDVLQYSTVKGKVTSGGKRLSPKTVNGDATHNASSHSNWVTLGLNDFTTDEVIDENGTYGESGNYIFWFDTNGNYEQYYPSGGTYVQISDRPLRVKKVNFSVEMVSDSTHK